MGWFYLHFAMYILNSCSQDDSQCCFLSFHRLFLICADHEHNVYLPLVILRLYVQPLSGTNICKIAGAIIKNSLKSMSFT